MVFVLPEGLVPEVYPLAWLVGHWRGGGVVVYPGIEEAAFVQEVHVEHDGGPYLRYTSTIRLVVVPDDPEALLDADPGPVWSTESGYWRVSPERTAALAEDQFPVELVLADAAGHLSLYLGTVGRGRIDLTSDLIARTSTASDVAAGKRLYGHVHGELMWAWDLAAFGHPLQTYVSARLARVDA